MTTVLTDVCSFLPFLEDSGVFCYIKAFINYAFAMSRERMCKMEDAADLVLAVDP